MRLAFVTDDFGHHAGVLLRQDDNGIIHASVQGARDTTAVKVQVRRILSLDQSGRGWISVGNRDPVLRRLQIKHPGVRPVLLHSPYEAAAWSILSARRHRQHATAIWRRFSERYGKIFDLAGEQLEAFPLPERLLKVRSFPGVEGVRMKRVHAVARAALDGKLDSERLLSVSYEHALEDLQTLPGIGPFYSARILLHSSGATDILPKREPRSAAYIANYYKLGRKAASSRQIRELAERWRPFRTWAIVLIRAAGDRANLT